ncbi:unnamed protein product [Durusdinium trenchii]|uniref:Uncharacterized protein n=1 Tax=Durusdinium trenchii TaxID=1381693 RepID=A0ABP0H687_9DINO
MAGLVLDQSFSSFCCAALCGSRGLRGHLEDPAEELEVRLFMRSWREIPYFLNESLQSSESWSLCAFCLQRFARDFDLVGVSKRGAYLPFLQLQGEQVFAFHLDPERPAAASKSPVLQMEAELPSALHAWLTICQPLALWAACGARNATGGVSAADGMQIAKALQKACSSGFFSEQQNLELREALREKAVMPLNGEA